MYSIDIGRSYSILDVFLLAERLFYILEVYIYMCVVCVCVFIYRLPRIYKHMKFVYFDYVMRIFILKSV